MIIFSKLELLTNLAMKAGFTGGVVVDFPNSTKAKKWIISILKFTYLLKVILFFYLESF